MSDFFLLTQDGCPKCEMVKRMLAGPLRDLEGRVEIIHRQSQPENFEAIVARTGIQAVPALLRRRDDAFQSRLSSLHDVKTFLQN